VPPESDYATYLADMLRYAREVVEMTRGRTLADYGRDGVLQLAVERAIEVIGEIARHISPAFQAEHPEVPWVPITKQRHVLAHDYGEVIPEKLSAVATSHVPQLIALLAPLLPPPPVDPEPGEGRSGTSWPVS